MQLINFVWISSGITVHYFRVHGDIRTLKQRVMLRLRDKSLVIQYKLLRICLYLL